MDNVVSDKEENAMDKKEKMKYEPPRMMPLGNLATGFGVACKNGSGATGNCSSGSSVDTGAGQCTEGGNANIHCSGGGTVST